MTLRQMTPLQQRLIVSSVGTCLVLIFILFSQSAYFKPLFIAAIAAMIGIATWELYQIAIGKGLKPAATLGISLSTLYTIAVGISTQFQSLEILPEITLLASLLCCFLYYFIKGQSPFMNLSVTIFSLAYLAIPLSCMIFIAYFFKHNEPQDGRWWLLYLVSVTKMTDTGGFFIGKLFGKQKLAPYISPKKTWEGALGGFTSAIVTSVLVYTLANMIDPHALSLTFWQSVCLGAGLGVVAQFGDLAESLLKRDGGVKDSNQLPGLGGMLDIVDSLVFTAPVVYIFLKVQAV
jgi:phosphatidate cytidylyltransferase